MIAALPMYDLPELRQATDAWWAGLAGHLRHHGVAGIPDALDRSTGRDDAWLSPDLLLAQTCGYPLTHALAGRVRYVATPCYAVPGCAGPRYRSAVVVRADSTANGLAALRGSVCAVNGTDSQSGYNVLRRMVAELADGAPFFSAVILSGGHRKSVAAVADGRADVAAVDCVTFALLQRYAPAETAPLRVLAWTAEAPGLPYITAVGTDDTKVEALRRALQGAVNDPSLADVREALGLADFAVLDDSAYGVILAMEAAARRLGYPETA
jgi:ABC-type phosphate/phosphonate transport system substrate-binding protein